MTEKEIIEWNDTVKKTNKAVMALDSIESKLEYLDQKFEEFKQNPAFYYTNIESWYKSQLTLLGIEPCDFMFLYPSWTSNYKMI